MRRFVLLNPALLHPSPANIVFATCAIARGECLYEGFKPIDFTGCLIISACWDPPAFMDFSKNSLQSLDMTLLLVTSTIGCGHELVG